MKKVVGNVIFFDFNKRRQYMQKKALEEMKDDLAQDNKYKAIFINIWLKIVGLK